MSHKAQKISFFEQIRRKYSSQGSVEYVNISANEMLISLVDSSGVHKAIPQKPTIQAKLLLNHITHSSCKASVTGKCIRMLQPRSRVSITVGTPTTMCETTGMIEIPIERFIGKLESIYDDTAYVTLVNEAGNEAYAEFDFSELKSNGITDVDTDFVLEIFDVNGRIDTRLHPVEFQYKTKQESQESYMRAMSLLGNIECKDDE